MPNNATPSSLLHAAAEVARKAGDAACLLYRSDIGVETKSDGSPVTIADRSAERIAREWIESRFPDDGILGEEEGEVRSGARRRWILDPIDGTKTFVAGVPLWGTLIAVAEGEEILAGAAYFPAVGELVVAAPGEGCWWNDTRCRVSATSALADATLLATDTRFRSTPGRRERWESLTANVRMVRTWGDCYGYLLVATGRADVMVDDRMNPWDAAALQPIIVEAGGVFTDWRGRATAFGGDSIATNSALSAIVRETLVGT
jgi:histidinol-phosphatase